MLDRRLGIEVVYDGGLICEMLRELWEERRHLHVHRERGSVKHRETSGEERGQSHKSKSLTKQPSPISN
jgi:hypothetical protein